MRIVGTITLYLFGEYRLMGGLEYLEWVILGFTLFGVINAFDLWITKIILDSGGVEFNPVARWFYSRWGIGGVAGVKVVTLTLIGIGCVVGSVDLYTIWYLCFMFVVILAFMYRDAVKAGVMPFQRKITRRVIYCCYG